MTGGGMTITGLHVAPTEPVALKRLGKSSLLPERYGVDVLWTVEGGDGRKCYVGCQRKEWKDLVASVEDGRWQREVIQMQSLPMAWVVVEGWPQVGEGGGLVDKRYGRGWTEAMLRAVLWSAMGRGVMVDRTANVAGTVEWVRGIVKWSRKAEHVSGLARPMATTRWGHRGNREWGMHLLQGLDGVGVELAGRIWDAFGGVPWRWDVGVEELMGVEGIGKKKAEKLYKQLGTNEGK